MCSAAQFSFISPEEDVNPDASGFRKNLWIMLPLSCRVPPTRLASLALLSVGCFFFADCTSLAWEMSWETESKERYARCM